jgi:hypothetical protein
MRKFNERLIEDLRTGKVAIKNDGTIEELRDILRYAFPDDDSPIAGGVKFYFVEDWNNQKWNCSNFTDLEFNSVKDFFVGDELTKEELIEKLKGLAKKDGMEVDVVFKEKRRTLVRPYNYPSVATGENMEILTFKFQVSERDKSTNLLGAMSYLSDYLEKYFNGEV